MFEYQDWLPFKFASARLDGKVHERTAIFIEATLAATGQRVRFQWDTGAPANLLYGRAAGPVLGVADEALPTSSASSASSTLPTEMALIFDSGLRMQVPFEARPALGTVPRSPDEPPLIGTLGYAFTRGMAIAIDYREQRIYWLNPEQTDALSARWPAHFSRYRESAGNLRDKILVDYAAPAFSGLAIFDTGSSMFELVVPPDQWALIPDTATADDRPAPITVPALGNPLVMLPKRTDLALTVGGQPVHVTLAYTLRDDDRMAPTIGNAPFLERIVVIDTVGKRFGVLPRR
ncbi:hypothetical protein PIN31009_00548 [Pandoraea iniqua]|uniref:hypothetical protein n=1 Tax=Pandoraea iniqua TaxID=2508288 RepID=UPI001242CDD7|nr:hypothetical protein [Pandoraea iniqua]VVD69754.1 hypothetical protein PIN31009_00548 [Pandoraea iniqua]